MKEPVRISGEEATEMLRRSEKFPEGAIVEGRMEFSSRTLVPYVELVEVTINGHFWVKDLVLEHFTLDKVRITQSLQFENVVFGVGKLDGNVLINDTKIGWTTTFRNTVVPGRVCLSRVKVRNGGIRFLEGLVAEDLLIHESDFSQTLQLSRFVVGGFLDVRKVKTGGIKIGDVLVGAETYLEQIKNSGVWELSFRREPKNIQVSEDIAPTVRLALPSSLCPLVITPSPSPQS